MTRGEKNQVIIDNLKKFTRPDHMVGPSRYSYQKVLGTVLPYCVKPGDVVLDFGAGNGNNRFLFQGMEQYGFDISVKSLRKFQENDCYFVGDGCEVPLVDECVDFIFCNWVLEYVPDPAAAITEMFRILKPGGRVYLGIPTHLDRIVNEGGALPLRVLTGRKNLMVEDGDEIYFSRDWIDKRMKGTGFSKVNITSTAGPCISFMRLSLMYLFYFRAALLKIGIEWPIGLLLKLAKSENAGKKLKVWVRRKIGRAYRGIDPEKQKTFKEYESYLGECHSRTKTPMDRMYRFFLELFYNIDMVLWPRIGFEVCVVASKPL